MKVRFIKSGRVCSGKSADLWIRLGLAEEVKDESPVAENELTAKDKPKQKRKPAPKKRGRKPAKKK